MTEAANVEVPDLVDFNDVEIATGSEELDEFVQGRIDARGVDTRSPMADFDARSDEEQKAIIRNAGERIRIVAPAGAGKTQTLVNRILSLVSAGTKGERILVLAFDNAAATAIREKIIAATARPNKPMAPVQVTTLAAYGYSLLHELFPAEHRPVAQAEVCNHIARSLLSRFRTLQPAASTLLPAGIKSSFYVALMGLIKNASFDPRSFDATDLARHLASAQAMTVFFHPKQPLEHRREIVKAIIWIFENYEILLNKAGTLDFDDQKLRALACLRAAPDALKTIHSSLDEVIVDEFQDISPLDFELISAVAEKARLVVTGDDDQAIYGFRGCTADYLIDFDQHCGRPVTSFELKTGYRCPRNIVAHAARLIASNPARIPKNPVAARQGDAQIRIISSATAAMEAKALASQIRKLQKEAPGLPYSEIAVLYRSNAQSLPIQLELILRDIPYHVRSRDSIAENGDLERLLSILRLKLAGRDAGDFDPADVLNCFRGFYSFLPAGADECVFNLRTGQQSFHQILSDPGMTKCLPNVDLSAFQRVWEKILAARTLLDILNVVAREFKGIGAMIGLLDEVMENEVPLGEILEIAAMFDDRIEDFVSRLGAALSKARTANFGRHQDGVALLTYLRAKGRQWHTVMIAGANEGVIPRQNASIPDERRLFYVGMTRASSNLIVSHVRKMCRTPVAVSRFVLEAGLDEAARQDAGRASGPIRSDSAPRDFSRAAG